MQDIIFNNDAYILNLFDNKFYKIDVKVNKLKINLKIGVSIQCFRGHPQQVRLCTLHCDVKCFDCNRRKSQTMYTCQLMIRGLNTVNIKNLKKYYKGYRPKMGMDYLQTLLENAHAYKCSLHSVKQQKISQSTQSYFDNNCTVSTNIASSYVKGDRFVAEWISWRIGFVTLDI